MALCLRSYGHAEIHRLLTWDEGDKESDRCREEGDKQKRRKETDKELACVALSPLRAFADYPHVDLRGKTKGGVGERMAWKSLRKKGSEAGTQCVCVCGGGCWEGKLN